MDYDDSKIDDDLDKLLQHIKEEQQNSLVKELKTCVCTCIVCSQLPSVNCEWIVFGSQHNCLRRQAVLLLFFSRRQLV